MRIIGHGFDMIEVERIARMMERHGEAFLARCFTQSEQGYCQSQAARRDEHLAARFAAKEAAFKALGTGWSGGIAWTDVEVTRSAAGAPGVAVHGVAAERARALGVTQWVVSLSHVRTMAAASVIAAGA